MGKKKQTEKMTMLTVRVPEPLAQIIKAHAALQGRTVQDVVTALLFEQAKRMEGTNILLQASPVYRELRQRMQAKKGGK